MTAAPARRSWKRWLGRGAIAGALVAVVIVRPYQVHGGSMQPGLAEGDWVLTLPYWGDPRRGDVVVFKAPEGSDWSIKRIVGMPGDHPRREWLRIQPTDGRAPIETSRLQWGSEESLQSPLAAESYFLLGDDPSQSIDSRNYGPIARSAVRRYVFASW